MSRLINLLSNDITGESVNDIIDLALDSDLSVLPPEHLDGLELVISNMLVLSQDSLSGAVVHNPIKAAKLLAFVRKLQRVK
jgi:hypothetical protein